MSKGFSAERFAHSELDMLQALDWQLAAPSPHAFVAHLVAVYFASTSEKRRDLIHRHAELYIDLSVFEIAMLHISQGTIAGAAFLCALRKMELNSRAIDEEFLQDLTGLLAVQKDVLYTTVQVRQ